MDEEKNLKGTKDKLKYFRLNETGSLEERTRLVNIYNEPTSKLYFYPEQDKIIFSEEEVKKFSLDKYGESIPYIDGELTIFNNYFFDFWGYYLTAEGTALYGHLKRYAYGSKDWSFPNIPLICAKMDKARSTVLRYLDILERYGFAFQFGVQNASRNNVEESPLFKLRKQIPLLPKKLIYGDPEMEIPDDAPKHIKKAMERERKGLPEVLRKAHEKFVGQHLQDTSALEEHVDFEKVYAAWTQFGEILKKNKRSNKPLASVGKAKITKEMTEHEKILLNFVLDEAEKTISKPSFDTWFKDIMIKVDKKTYTIYAPNEFSRDWLQERYSNFITECITKLEKQIESISFEQY
ncbi:DnaA N-terminal domain-containing protein [Mesobacillus zeae]|uniref:DnaA N-terminal domain-containing protein n=1 Tax=Mesobacillus zeae TaxID=1917180 RepID=UPI003009FF51